MCMVTTQAAQITEASAVAWYASCQHNSWMKQSRNASISAGFWASGTAAKLICVQCVLAFGEQMHMLPKNKLEAACVQVCTTRPGMHSLSTDLCHYA